jgi:hypothetical protein
VYQVENNVGINRANYDVQRAIEHNVLIERQQLRHERIIQFKNTAENSVWPRGTYQTYVSLYVPTTAQLESVEVDGVRLANKDVVFEDVFGKKQISFLVSVPIQTTKLVKVYYHEPIAVAGEASTTGRSLTPLSVVFFDQRQAGVGSDPLRVTLFYDQGLTPTVVAPSPWQSSDRLIFISNREKNTMVGVTLR